MYEQVLSALASSASGSSYGNTHAPQSGAPIFVAPVGLNLGEILLGLNEGNPETGGYGTDLISRLGFDKYSPNNAQYTAKTSGDLPLSNTTLLIIMGVGGVVLFLLMKKRG